MDSCQGQRYDLAKLDQDRPVYLWGASQAGIGMLFALRRMGIQPVAFLDQRHYRFRRPLYGLPVLSPSEILEGATGEQRPFIIDSTFQHKDEIATLCVSAGLKPDVDFISHDQCNPLDILVIVSSVCNLRCISCPVGNVKDRVPTGMMTAAVFEQVLDKLLREAPYLGIIQLYNWGEPLLNRELPAMLRLAREREVLCAISSNLSLKCDLEEIVRAGPGCFRISLSGWGDSYALTHTHGNWELVLNNMRELARLRNDLNPELPVEVAYHLYRHNDTDYHHARDLCEELGFEFRPHLAALLPLDNVRDYLVGQPLSQEACQTLDLLKIPIDQAIEQCSRERALSCNFDHSLNIDFDLSVKVCGLYFQRHDNVIADNYLEVPLKEILSRWKGNRLCPSCRQAGLHRFCRYYTQTSDGTLIDQTPKEQKPWTASNHQISVA